MKYLAPFLILLFSYNFVYSQLSFGFTGGFNVNGMTKDSYSSTGMRYAPFFTSNFINGFHMGVFVEIPLEKKLLLQPELRLIQRGTDAGEGSESIELFYLELPALLVYKPVRWVSFEGGPVVSYTLTGKIADSDFYDTFQTYPLGAEAGINFHLTDRIAIGASFYHGVTPALRMKFHRNGGSLLAEDRYYNKSLQVSLRGMLFSVKSE